MVFVYYFFLLENKAKLFFLSLLGPTGKSILAFWNLIYNVGSGFRWCSSSCSVKNPTSCNDGITKFSCFFEWLFLFNYEARSITFYKEGVVRSKHGCLFDFYGKFLLFPTWLHLCCMYIIGEIFWYLTTQGNRLFSACFMHHMEAAVIFIMGPLYLQFFIDWRIFFKNGH